MNLRAFNQNFLCSLLASFSFFLLRLSRPNTCAARPPGHGKAAGFHANRSALSCTAGDSTDTTQIMRVSSACQPAAADWYIAHGAASLPRALIRCSSSKPAVLWQGPAHSWHMADRCSRPGCMPFWLHMSHIACCLCSRPDTHLCRYALMGEGMIQCKGSYVPPAGTGPGSRPGTCCAGAVQVPCSSLDQSLLQGIHNMTPCTGSCPRPSGRTCTACVRSAAWTACYAGSGIAGGNI